MKMLPVFSLRDLHIKAGEILKHAEKGEVSLIMAQDRPSFLAVPFDDFLVKHGVNRSLAVDLFETGAVTLSQAAKMADLPMEGFIELLGEQGVNVVNYSPEDLDSELDDA
jgi:antitoxin (DNA-binding transcriptional repressor) of toxin-antitoxin stability system